MINVCVAGATGWTGRAVTEAVLDASDMELVGAVSRQGAGQDIGTLLGREACGVLCTASVSDMLDNTPSDVLIDYTHPTVVMDHTREAVGRGIGVIVGTSGLVNEDFKKIDAYAREQNVGVVASGNFAITAALLNHFALIAARYIDHFEIIDYAKSAKPDAPSGTARELAERLGDVKKPQIDWPVDDIIGPSELRGGSINGVQVHAVRLPSYAASVDAIFTVPGSRLVIKHDAGMDASIYADGTLLAARKVSGITGLCRGLDSLLFGTS